MQPFSDRANVLGDRCVQPGLPLDRGAAPLALERFRVGADLPRHRVHDFEEDLPRELEHERPVQVEDHGTERAHRSGHSSASIAYTTMSTYPTPVLRAPRSTASCR